MVPCAQPQVPVELRALAREFELGGVLCQAAALVDTLQAADLMREIGTLAREVPLWTGLWPGVRKTIPPLTDWPPVLTLTRADAADLTAAFARARARELLALGCSFAAGPVLDLGEDSGANADRPGSDPLQVARHAARIVEISHAEGLATCAAHFPGLRSAVRDSALAWPLVDAAPEELDAVDWQPFRAVIAAGVPAVLAAHVLVPGLDDRAPAAQSRALVSEALRGRLHFGGTVFADGTGPAVEPGAGLPAPVVRTFAAGCDVVLLPSARVDDAAEMLEHVVREAERNPRFVLRLEEALRRHETMKAAYLSEGARRRRPAPPSLTELLASADGERVADRMRAFA